MLLCARWCDFCEEFPTALTLCYHTVQTRHHEHEALFPTGRSLHGAQANLARVRLPPGKDDLIL